MKNYDAYIIPRFKPSYSVRVRAEDKDDALIKATRAAQKKGEVQFIEVEEKKDD